MKKYAQFIAFVIMAVFSHTFVSCGDNDDEPKITYNNITMDCKTTHTIKGDDSPDFVIVSPKSLRQRVLLFSDVLPSALFGCKSPCSEVA